MTIIFDQYAERLHRLKRDKSTVKGFEVAARELKQYLAENGIEAENLQSHELEDYFAELDLAASTKKLRLSHIGAAYRYAQRRGLVPRDPTVDVLIERVPDKEPRTLTSAELRAIKADLVIDREWLLFHLLAYTGMRRGEILGLRWEDVKLADNTITVVGKGGKLRHIPIHPALSEVLVAADHIGERVLSGRSGRPTSARTVWEIVNQWPGDFTPHDFRRTVASSLYANGVDGDTIDKIMGWSPRVVRTRYYQAIAGPQLQRAILKLYRDDPI